ncbi:MAG: hypothetical protein JWR49_3885, partial [Tardiphaga sp.]|nr:hypothetical protein [Tardiphaga sp.]
TTGPAASGKNCLFKNASAPVVPAYPSKRNIQCPSTMVPNEGKAKLLELRICNIIPANMCSPRACIQSWVTMELEGTGIFLPF